MLNLGAEVCLKVELEVITDSVVNTEDYMRVEAK